MKGTRFRNLGHGGGHIRCRIKNDRDRLNSSPVCWLYLGTFTSTCLSPSAPERVKLSGRPVLQGVVQMSLFVKR